MGILISAHFTISYEILGILFFLGKVFGGLRLLSVFLSLFGLQLGIRFLQEKICGVEGLILLTDALCVGVMGDGGSSATSLWKGLLVVEFGV